MITTMDSAGRLVIPKSVRDEAGLQPNVPVDVTYRDGHVEIAPAPRRVSLTRKGRVAVARAEQPSEPLSSAAVERARQRLRERR